MVEAPRFWRDQAPECDGELRLGAAELRVGNTVDLIADCELAHVRTGLLNEACEVGTKCERRPRTYLALPLANDCVPWSDARGGNAHQHLSFLRRGPGNIFDNDDLRRPETVNAHCLHVNHSLSAGIRRARRLVEQRLPVGWHSSCWPRNRLISGM